ncbi:hypothetical protein HK101_004466 [Irineochytrium annulatum]|nr:hypothetical protein HK101_004466 [Irineochytrium annulatum]
MAADYEDATVDIGWVREKDVQLLRSTPRQMMNLLDLPNEVLAAIASKLPPDRLPVLLSLCRRTRQVVDANLVIPSFAASCVSLFEPPVQAEAHPVDWGRLGKVFCDALLDRVGLMQAAFSFHRRACFKNATNNVKISPLLSALNEREDPTIEASLREYLVRNPWPADVCEANHFHFRLSCTLGLTSIARLPRGIASKRQTGNARTRNIQTPTRR